MLAGTLYWKSGQNNATVKKKCHKYMEEVKILFRGSMIIYHENARKLTATLLE